MTEMSRGPLVGTNGQLSLESERHTLDEPLLTPADAAALLSVRTSWVYEAVRARRLPCVRVGLHEWCVQTRMESSPQGR